jgi:predicted dehydrogenase
MKIGLVGYGMGGQCFHAPFIAAAEGVELTGVVARAPETIAKVEVDFPGLPVFPSLAAMIETGGVDAVTITTPPQTRSELVLQAIEAGLHVIADKPFAPTAEAARDLDAAAKARGVVLGAFHNRRWDADAQTLRKVLDSERLGRLWRLHSRMEQSDPTTLEAGPTGGLLRDLGSHVVDQALWLLGPVASVNAQLDMVDLPQGRTDAGFVLSLRHASGVWSYIEASKLNRLAVKEYRAYGDSGSFVVSSADIQAESIFAGLRPADDPVAWGYESEDHWGTIRTATGEERVPSEQGRYHDYYTAFARAVRDGAPPPVSAEEAIRTLAVLDAARTSALEGRSVEMETLRA